MKKRLPIWIAVLGSLLVPGTVKGKFVPWLCPQITITVPGTNDSMLSFRTGVVAGVTASCVEIPGDCNGVSTYSYKRWYWRVGGVTATPMNGTGSGASFKILSMGSGQVIFDLICRSAQCPDCHEELQMTVPFCVEDGPYYGESCIQSATMSLSPISLSPAVVCLGGAISASATLTKTSGKKECTTAYDCRPAAVTTNLQPASVTSSYSIAGPFVTNGGGLSCTFTPTNPGVGTITMWCEDAGTSVCSVDPYRVDSSANYKVLKIEFVDSSITNCWNAGVYDASANLTADSYDTSAMSWSLATVAGDPSATIDPLAGSVTPGLTAGGIYTIRAQSTEVPGCYDEMTLTILKVDLNIYNGKNGSAVAEDVETSEGAIFLVNCDDDNGNMMPDYDPSETTVADENDLAQIDLSIEPSINTGTVKLEATAGGANIAVWKTSQRGGSSDRIYLPKTWDLNAGETVPALLWVEGMARSDIRGVGLSLSYQNGGFSCTDEVAATVVFVHEGCPVYRELTSPVGARGHTGILVAYTGTCSIAELNDDSKYEVLEMAPPLQSINLQQFRSLPYWGTYRSSDATPQNALAMIDNARDIVSRTAAVIYSWNDVVEPASWWQNPTAANITALRCDGFVEGAQEMTDIMVWGHRIAPDTYNFDIRASQQIEDEHNAGEISEVFWSKYLFPSTQCAHESTYRFTHWNTRLSRVNAASLRPYEPVFP